MKNRILNYRPFAIIFLGLIIGVNIVGAILKADTMLWVVLIVLSSLISLFFAVYSIILFRYKNENDSDYVMNNKHYKNRATVVIKGVCLFVLAIILGLSSGFATVGHKLGKLDAIISDDSASLDCTLVGRVAKTNGTTYAVLEDITIDGASYKGIKIKISAIDTNGNFDLQVGDIVSSETRIFKNSFVYNNGELNFKLLTDNIFYSGYFKSTYIDVSHGKTNIFEKINITTREKLEKYMSKDNAGVATALLLGDKDYLDDDVYASFQKSGLAHILSISGLHVGFIVVLLVYFLKKSKLSSKVQFVICIAFLGLYSTICGFSSSVVRASIMSLCMMLSFLCKERGDMLSSLGLSGILIMLINPFNALTLGFKLSFLAVFGLITLSEPFNRFLTKLHIPQVISASVATTLSAELMTLPVVANCFGGLPVVGLIANLLILPVFSVLFSILFVVFLINIALPLGILFVPFSYVLTSIVSVTSVLSSFAIINLLWFSGLATVSYYVLLFIISNFVMLKPKLKLYVSSVLVVVLTISLIACNFSEYKSQNTILAFSGVENTVAVTTEKSEFVLIGMGDGSDYEYNLLELSLDRKQIKSIDVLCLPLYTASNQDKLIEMCASKRVDNVILPSSLDEIQRTVLLEKLPARTNVTFSNFDSLSFSNLTISGLKASGKIKVVMVQAEVAHEVKQILLVQDKLTENQASKIIESYALQPNFVVANTYSVGLETLFTKLAKDYKIIFNSNSNYESTFLSHQSSSNFVSKIDSLCWTYSF